MIKEDTEMDLDWLIHSKLSYYKEELFCLISDRNIQYDYELLEQDLFTQ
jgi:hypothetical protein